MLTGLAGETLLAVAQRHKYSFVDGACGGGGSPVDVLHAEGNWLEPKYGEGAYCHFCHVIIPKSHYGMVPAKRPDETEQLGKYPFKEDLAETCVATHRAVALLACRARRGASPTLTLVPPRSTPCRCCRSRLACQVKLTKELEGMIVYVPDGPSSDLP